jgi:hypothetical protein
MAYCRWGDDSDVYVYEHIDGIYICHAGLSGTFYELTPGKCAKKLEELRSKGLKVPQYAIDELRYEEKEMSDGHSHT